MIQMCDKNLTNIIWIGDDRI